MNSPERRSVGELLEDTDLTARRLLLDPDDLDTAAMIRVWPELVQAANELLASLPSRGPHAIPGVEATPTRTDPLAERLHLMATALNDNLRGRAWPGDGPADERLLDMTGNLVHTHDLIDRRLRDTTRPSTAMLTDAAAARTRVLHALYVTAHAITLATGAEIRDLQTNGRALQRRSGVHKLTALKLMAARIDTFEQVAGAEVYQAFPKALVGNRRDEAAPGLRMAFAAWEVETHRAMVHEPTMANIFEVSRVQASTIALTHLLFDAAGGCGAIDAGAYRANLQPVLAAAESAWGALHFVARDLTSMAPRLVARDLRLAGTQLVHALTQLALDGTSVATQTLLSERIASNHLLATLVSALESHRDSAQVLMDAVLDPRLGIKADAAQRVLADLASGNREALSPQEPWIDPRDIALGRQVPLPAPVRGALIRHVEIIDSASRRLATASVDTSQPVQPPRTQDQGQVRTSTHRGALVLDTQVAPRVAR
ncbi:hypothetical protein [Phycicoccus sonneratiae]|uniref:DUF222 domain-containing protein n=1 Tax=Phycicoccus sonneratiae TaxID=2807628 RepID=A0ABS2CQI4_9MICO|nr:hypothetical protein [Phycicoccus sonneraticus]MBM6402157.1 hypothetical protein [Phycicoccus sonneraticus]